MKTVYVLFAEGFEEIEALTVVDLLRRAGVEVKMTSITTAMEVTGGHGITVKMDMTLDKIQLDHVQAVVLPGGMPGTKNLGACEAVKSLLHQANEKEILIGAICAAPSVLGDLKILEGRKAVCYPGFEERLSGAEVCQSEVAVDGHIITSRGMGTAIAFSLALIEQLCKGEKAKEIAAAIIYTAGRA